MAGTALPCSRSAAGAGTRAGPVSALYHAWHHPAAALPTCRHPTTPVHHLAGVLRRMFSAQWRPSTRVSQSVGA